MLTSELTTVWITSDGNKYLSEKKANLHEISLSTKDVLSEWSKHREECLKSLNQNIKEKIEWLRKQQQNLK